MLPLIGIVLHIWPPRILVHNRERACLLRAHELLASAVTEALDEESERAISYVAKAVNLFSDARRIMLASDPKFQDALRAVADAADAVAQEALWVWMQHVAERVWLRDPREALECCRRARPNWFSIEDLERVITEARHTIEVREAKAREGAQRLKERARCAHETANFSWNGDVADAIQRLCLAFGISSDQHDYFEAEFQLR
jgi:hypothetical protein